MAEQPIVLPRSMQEAAGNLAAGSLATWLPQPRQSVAATRQLGCSNPATWFQQPSNLVAATQKPGCSNPATRLQQPSNQVAATQQPSNPATQQPSNPATRLPATQQPSNPATRLPATQQPTGQPSNPATVGNRFSTVGAFWHLAATDDFAVKIGARAAELRQLTRPLNAPPVAAAEPVFCPRGLFAAASTTACRCVSLASGTEIVWLRMPSELYLPFGGSKVLSPPPCCDSSNAQIRTSLENQKVSKGVQSPIREEL